MASTPTTDRESRCTVSSVLSISGACVKCTVEVRHGVENTCSTPFYHLYMCDGHAGGDWWKGTTWPDIQGLGWGPRKGSYGIHLLGAAPPTPC
eukprot:5995002-Pyramimonas_sp.AAC.2